MAEEQKVQPQRQRWLRVLLWLAATLGLGAMLACTGQAVYRTYFLPPYRRAANRERREEAERLLWLTSRRDPRRAAQLLDEAASEGDVLAGLRLYTVDEQFFDGAGRPSGQEEQRTAVAVQQLVLASDADAQWTMAAYLYYTQENRNDTTVSRHNGSLQNAQGAAGMGNMHAQALLGFIHEQSGFGGAAEDEIVRHYTAAAKAGHPGAMYRLAHCYLEFHRLPDEAAAFRLYSDAAQADYIYAPSAVGWCHELGVGTARNVDRALEWYRRGMEHGDPHAYYRMAHCYLHGTGVKQDLLKSRELLEQSIQLYDWDEDDSAHELLGYLDLVEAGLEPMPGPAETHFESDWHRKQREYEELRARRGWK